MSWLSDESIDEKTVEVDGESMTAGNAIQQWTRVPVDLPGLKRAARMYRSASPAMLEGGAQWLYVGEQLGKSSLSPREAAGCVVYGVIDKRFHVPSPVMVDMLTALDAEDLAALLDEVRAEEDRAHQMDFVGESGVIALARKTGELPERFDELISLTSSGPSNLKAEALDTLPESRRRRLFEELLSEPSNRRNAIWRAEKALDFQHLMDEELQGRLERFIESINEVEDSPDWPVESDQGALKRLEALKSQERIGQEIGEDGLTADVRRALDYWKEKLAEQELKAGLGPLAESRANLGINVNAPELGSLQDWDAASEARKLEIAKAVEKELAELDISFAGLESYEDAPEAVAIAVFQHEGTGMHLSLVPGGTYQRGFSEREEEVVRKVAKDNKDVGNYFEEYEYLFEQAPSMRPVKEVTAEPVLVFQMPAEPRHPAEVTVMLEEMPFRLLTEAEYEWVSRGGKESRLTWRGDDVPDEAWLEEVMEKGPELRNPFGMAFLGLNPEVLTDVWKPGYQDAPIDGSARTGEGPRVVRGGAAMIYPWQACGEWQLLTNAVRTGSDGWEYFLSIRPALGVGISTDG